MAPKTKGNAATEWLNAAVEESKANHVEAEAPASRMDTSASTLPTDFFDLLVSDEWRRSFCFSWALVLFPYVLSYLSDLISAPIFDVTGNS